jgi:hypothetical protein
LFVLVQKFAPKLVDRVIATQMADPRIRDYLDKHCGAAPAPAGHRQIVEPAKGSADPEAKPRPTSVPVGVPQPA